MKFFFAMKNFLLKSSFFGWILLVILIPFFTITYLAVNASSDALYSEITDNLSLIANQKASDIERFINTNKNHAMLLAKNPLIIDTANTLSQQQKITPNLEHEINLYLRNITQLLDLKDIFIVSPEGIVIFSMYQPELINLNYKDTTLKNTVLGKVINKTRMLLDTSVSNFVVTNQSKEPQLYIATPILTNQQVNGVLVLQMNNLTIEQIIHNISYLGDTGETLVGESNISLIVPFSNLRHASVEEFQQKYNPSLHNDLYNAFSAATLGKKGVGQLIDYRNQKVIAAWQYIPSMHWGILVKIDQSEAFKAIDEFKQHIYFLSSITLLLALFLAFTITRKFQTNENELKRLLTEIQLARNEAFDANRAKSAFLANMSHELRTPLNAITGYSEMLIEDATDKELNDFVEDLKKINGAGQHLLGLINDILDISKIEAGHMDIYLEEIELKPMLEDIKALVIPLVQKKNNQFKLEASDNLGIMYVDVTKLRQCLLNLISNASKFTENGSISLKVKPIEFNNQECIEFSLNDTGIGMNPEQLAKMFQAFTQADISTTRKFGGTGLGLYLTQRFTHMLKGEITVVSEIDKGSTFTLIIPRLSNISKVETTSEKETIPASLSLPKVLIIDDDKTIHTLIEENLNKHFHCIHAYNGEEGLKLARKYHPDAITLDIIMPGIDGWTVLKNLRMDPNLSTIPIIMCSVTGDKDLGYTLGISDFLIKPVDPLLLMKQLNKFIGENVVYVLIVEDDPITRQLMVRTLQKAGLSTQEAENGRQGLDLVQQLKPSAILLDLMMPVMNGFEFVEQLRKNKNWSDIPILVITAKDISETERAQLNNAFTTIMKKGGYSRKDLIRTLHEKIECSFQKNGNSDC